MSFSSIGSTALLDSLITPATLAARLGTTGGSLSEWRITGRGPKFIRVGRSPRFRPEDVNEWLLAGAREYRRGSGRMGGAYSYDTKNGTRGEARYRKPDGKTARKGGFTRERDAEACITSVESAKLQGAYSPQGSLGSPSASLAQRG